MRIPIGGHPERSASLPGQTWGAMYLGTGDDNTDIHSFAWRGYCITCGAVSPNDQPMTRAWDEGEHHHERMHRKGGA